MVYSKPQRGIASECLRPVCSGLLSGVSIVFLIFGVLTGCATSMRAESDRPVLCAPLEILIEANPLVFQRAKLAVLPFETPDYAPGAGMGAAEAYVQELLRTAAFAQSIVVPYHVKSDEEAVLSARRDGFDLVMRSSILYLLDGSGALPTHLETSIRVLDVRSAKTLWYLKQKAYSEPGPDVDLFWTTLSGNPAQRYEMLAKALAEQFSTYMTSRAMK